MVVASQMGLALYLRPLKPDSFDLVPEMEGSLCLPLQEVLAIESYQKHLHYFHCFVVIQHIASVGFLPGS